MVSGHRGRRPNNAIGVAVRREMLKLVRDGYPDFGPTFACEKLVEVHGQRLSVETLRGWMIERSVEAEGPAGGGGVNPKWGFFQSALFGEY